MIGTARTWWPLRVFLPRAVVLYVATRILLAMAVAMARSDSPFPDAVERDNVMLSIGMVILTTAMATIDVRRRRESVLWANLGIPAYMFGAIAAAIAIVGESMLSAFAS